MVIELEVRIVREDDGPAFGVVSHYPDLTAEPMFLVYILDIFVSPGR